ncbi:MAG: type I secretion C-terminal target domain-containing protein [Rhodospirillales bacterium]|nr:type I secretion C-terminal target domain-containing protein [Rhodospirillales bacterium]
MVLRLLFDKIDDGTTGEWLHAGEYFWPILYDHSFANSIGVEHISGKSTDYEKYADIMRTVLGYSAIEADGGLVYGNTGARALYDDATDFGKALSTIGAATSLTTYATDISKAFIHYATHLALSHVGVLLESTAVDVRSGIVEYDPVELDTLTVNFQAPDWSPIFTSLKPTMAVTRDALVEHVLDNFYDYVPNETGLRLDDYIKHNWLLAPLGSPLASPGEVFNRVIFAALDSGSNEILDTTGEYLGYGLHKTTLYVGGAGNDTVSIAPLTGNPEIFDSVVFLGYDGNNVFVGGYDRDIAIGGNQVDQLFGDKGNDFIFGYDGNDALSGGEGNDIVIGGKGDDYFYGSINGNDVFHGGLDSDELYPFWNNGGPIDITMDIDRIDDGTDTVNYTGLSGAALDITILDTAESNFWVDKYYSGTLFNGVFDRDYLYSIEGIIYDGLTVNQSGGTAVYGDENVNSMHYNYYGTYNDAHSYYGLGANDTITAGFKNDVLVGGADEDILSGNRGNDVYVYNRGDGSDYINDAGLGSDLDKIQFGADILSADITLGRYGATSNMIINIYEDSSHQQVSGSIEIYAQAYSGGKGIDYLLFGDGELWDMQGTLVPVYGTSANETLFGTAISSNREGSLIDDLIYAGGGNDIVNGFGGHDVIFGGGGDDINLYGESGNDVIFGESGQDFLKGGSGHDILIGGSEADILAGETDSDTFVFQAATAFSGIDTITDFKLTQSDKLDISDVLYGFYDYMQDLITDFVQITTSGSSSLLFVDQDGGADNFTQIATLQSITGLTDVTALESAGTLITHDGFDASGYYEGYPV